MAKLIHTMIRVRELERSLKFYEAVLDMKESHRLDFPEFTLVYLRADGCHFENELTLNKGREDEYTHGTGYGHVAVVVPDANSKRAQVDALGYAPTAVKEFKRGEELLARFFFVQDPDGSANVGCILHLQSGTTVPVQHWVEMVDQALA